MKDSTLKMIELALKADDTVTSAERTAILASCREPAPSTVAGADHPSAPPERWLTPRRAAVALSVSLRTVRRLVRSGGLPSRKVLGCRRIPASAIAVAPPPGEEDVAGWPSRGATGEEDFWRARVTKAAG